MGFALALGASSQCESASSPSSMPAGHYDGTKVSDVTGDEDGLRLELKYVAGTPEITFWQCEGECFTHNTHNLSIVGNQITFIADDELSSPDGKKFDRRPREFSGRFQNGQLLLGSPGFWKPQRLKWIPILTHEQEIQRARKLLREHGKR